MHQNPQNVRRMRSVVNISHQMVEIDISGTPGSAPMRYEIEPGHSADMPPGYVEVVQGAGRNTLPSIIARRTNITWPDGKRRPALVPAEDAKRLIAEYEAQGAYGKVDAKADDKSAAKTGGKK